MEVGQLGLTPREVRGLLEAGGLSYTESTVLGVMDWLIDYYENYYRDVVERKDNGIDSLARDIDALEEDIHNLNTRISDLEDENENLREELKDRGEEARFNDKG